MPFIASIVEGHGEIEALPILLRRLAPIMNPPTYFDINPPLLVKAPSFMQMGDEFNRYVRMAAAKAAQERGGVLILLDCDDGCPADLGPKLLTAAKAARSDVPYLVVLADREFETWFVAAAESLRSSHGLLSDLELPTNPESIRGAKEWLNQRMSVKYRETEHQAKFAAVFDLEQARRASSFDRLLRRLPAFLADIAVMRQ